MQKRMVGKFYPTPDEIIDDLFSLSPSAIVLYFSLTMRHYVEEDSTSDDGWVMGKVKAKQKIIIEKSTLSRPTYYKSLYELIECGLIKIENEEFLVLKLKRVESKADTEREVEVIEHRITRNILKVIMKEIRDLYGLHEEGAEEENQMFLNLEEKVLKNLTEINQKDEKVLKNLTENYENEQANSGLGVKNFNKSVKNFNKTVQNSLHASIDLERIDQKNLSLSLISLFYSTIGQTKISKEKRERALKSFEEMRKDGFTDDDIEFAVKWIPENAKVKPYDFAIVPNMIGQALAARDEYEKKERRQAEKEAEKALHEEEERKSSELKDHSRLVKERMTPDERKELKQKAIESLEAQGMKKQFITQMLIEAEENKILMESGVIDHEDQS